MKQFQKVSGALIQYLSVLLWPANIGVKKFCHLESIIFYSTLSFHLSHITIERKTYAQTLADFHISQFFKSLRLLSTTGINLNNTNIFSVSYFKQFSLELFNTVTIKRNVGSKNHQTFLIWAYGELALQVPIATTYLILHDFFALRFT